MNQSNPPKPLSGQAGLPFAAPIWLGIHFVTLAFMAIILVGQYRIYPQLRIMEARIESLATQLSQQKASSQSSLPVPTEQSDEVSELLRGAGSESDPAQSNAGHHGENK